MRQGLLNGAIFQVAALITSVIIVHMAYVAVIRPNAEIVAQQQEYLQQTDPDYTPERSFYVVLRDFEQETCIILFLWATAIIGLKAKQTLGDRKLLDRNLLQVTEGTSILPQDARNFARPRLATTSALRYYRARLLRAYIVFRVRKIFRTSPLPSKMSASPKPIAWKPNWRLCVTSRGQFRLLASSALSAESAPR